MRPGLVYLDVTPEIYLSAFVCIKSILISIKATRIESNPTSILADSNSLRSNPKGIFYIDVVHFEVVLVHTKGTTGVIRTCPPSVNPGLNIHLIAFISGGVGCVAIDLVME